MKIISLCVLLLFVTLLVEPDDLELIDALLIAVVVRATCAKVKSIWFLDFAGPESPGCLAGGLYMNSR